MTFQLCIAPHRDNPPSALGGLLLCAGHHATLTEALTGPSAVDDPTIECRWGYMDGQHIVLCADAHRADVERAAAIAIYMERIQRTAFRLGQSIAAVLGPPPGPVMCGDDDGWCLPHEYRPGGLARDWAALAGLTGHKTAAASYVSGSSEPRLPINPAVAELRDRIPGVLASWARVHLEESPYAMTPPKAGTPAVLCAWLAVHREWAAAQPWTGEYVAELGQLRARARKLIDLPRRPRAVVGPCVEYVDGQRCGGTLSSAIRDEDDPRASLIECDGCEAAYDSTQWMRLGQRVALQARRMAA